MKKIDKERLKALLTADVLANYYKFDLPRGDNKNIKSPLRDENTPSFTITTEGGTGFMYHDKSLNKGGDAFSFIAEKEGLDPRCDFMDIMKKAIEITNAGESIYSTNYSPSKIERSSPSQLAVKRYCEEKDIPYNSSVMDSLGFVVSENNLQENELHLPMFNEKGEEVGLQSASKVVKGTSSLGLFMNNNTFDWNSDCIIVEGLSDYVALSSSGAKNIVGMVSLTMGLTEESGNKESSILMRFIKKLKGTPTFVFDMDNVDKYGEAKPNVEDWKGFLAALNTKRKLKNKCRIVFMPTAFEDVRKAVSGMGGANSVIEYIKDNANSETLLSLQRMKDGSYSFDDPSHIARKIISKYDLICYATDEVKPVFYQCNPTTKIWQILLSPQVDKIIIDFIENVMGMPHKPAQIKSVKSYIAAFTIEEAMKVRIEILTKGSHRYVFFKNGKFDLETGEMKEYKREDFVSMAIDFEYVPGKSDKNMRDFISSLFAKEEEALFMQEWLGYTLLRSAKYAKFMWIYGKGGDGKSVLIKAIEKMVGLSLFGTGSFNSLNDRFGATELQGKSVFVSQEALTDSFEGPVFKSLTGGDTLKVEMKGLNERLTLFPTATPIGVSNNKPSITRSGEWLYRRLITVELTKSFTESGEADTEFTDRVIADREGNIEFAIQGAMATYKRKKFDIPERFKNDSDEMIKRADHVSEYMNYFKKTRRREASNEMYGIDFVYANFREHCQNAGISPSHIPQKKNFIDRVLLMKQEGFSLIDNGLDYTLVLAKGKPIKKAEPEMKF